MEKERKRRWPWREVLCDGWAVWKVAPPGWIRGRWRAAEASSVGLKSTKRVVGPSNTLPNIWNPKNRTPKDLLWDQTKAPFHKSQQKITDIGIQPRRRNEEKSEKVCFFGAPWQSKVLLLYFWWVNPLILVPNETVFCWKLTQMTMIVLGEFQHFSVRINWGPFFFVLYYFYWAVCTVYINGINEWRFFMFFCLLHFTEEKAKNHRTCQWPPF